MVIFGFGRLGEYFFREKEISFVEPRRDVREMMRQLKEDETIIFYDAELNFFTLKNPSIVEVSAAAEE